MRSQGAKQSQSGIWANWAGCVGEIDRLYSRKIDAQEIFNDANAASVGDRIILAGAPSVPSAAAVQRQGSDQIDGRVSADVSRVDPESGEILGRCRRRAALVQEMGQGAGVEAALCE